jgi:ElaB/YqjD/DUF883 family membrane-anchored ribosome-binding protein
MESRYDNPAQAASDAGQDLKKGVQEMSESGREAAGKLTAALSNAKQKIQEKTKDSAEATDRAIRQPPYESIGIAFGIGVLIGVLINRR